MDQTVRRIRRAPAVRRRRRQLEAALARGDGRAAARARIALGHVANDVAREPDVPRAIGAPRRTCASSGRPRGRRPRRTAATAASGDDGPGEPGDPEPASAGDREAQP
jgi:hypothetical protein